MMSVSVFVAMVVGVGGVGIRIISLELYPHKLFIVVLSHVIYVDTLNDFLVSIILNWGFW